MKIRNGFVSNSSSTSFTTMEYEDSYCPCCFSNKSISNEGGSCECNECFSTFCQSELLTLKEIRKQKLDKLDIC